MSYRISLLMLLTLFACSKKSSEEARQQRRRYRGTDYYNNPYSRGYVYQNGRIYKPVVVSDIGLTHQKTHDRHLVYATHLEDARPLSGVTITLRTYQNQIVEQKVTDRNGLADFSSVKSDVFYIEAEKDGQRSFIKLGDMAVLFRGLGNGGVFQPLHINPADRPSEPPPLLSRGACYLVLNTLRDLSRPGVEFYWHQFQNQWPIAWKTGTSYGHRDAWAVGVSPQWTIAVWVGNFTGEGVSELTGARCAAPLFFDLFNSLPHDPGQRWFASPQVDLIQRDVCADTGYRAAPHCPERVSVDAPRSLLRICPYHQVITVNADSTQRVCSLCWQSGEYRRVARLVYPPDVVHHLRQRGQSAGDLPPHRADCAAQADHAPVHIVYPTRNARLYLPRDFDGTVQNVVLRVTHRDKNRTLYWYLNHRYLGKTNTRHVKSIALPTGQHTLEVIDEIGHRDQTRFYVSSR